MRTCKIYIGWFKPHEVAEALSEKKGWGCQESWWFGRTAETNLHINLKYTNLFTFFYFTQFTQGHLLYRIAINYTFVFTKEKPSFFLSIHTLVKKKKKFLILLFFWSKGNIFIIFMEHSGRKKKLFLYFTYILKMLCICKQGNELFPLILQNLFIPLYSVQDKQPRALTAALNLNTLRAWCFIYLCFLFVFISLFEVWKACTQSSQIPLCS